MDFYYRDEALSLDTHKRLVLLSGKPLTLGEYDYRLLITLIRHAPDTVSQDTLKAEVWKERVVSDDNLKKRISALRAKLKDTEPFRFIRTEKGLGYRWLPEHTCTNQGNQNHVTSSRKALLKPADIFSLKYKVITCICLAVLISIGFSMQLPVNSDFKQTNHDAHHAKLQVAEQQLLDFNKRSNQKANLHYQELLKSTSPSNANAKVLAHYALSFAYGYYFFDEPTAWQSQALLTATQAYEKAPDSVYTNAVLGFSYYINHQYQKAHHHIEYSLTLEPKWGLLYAYQALLLIDRGNVLEGHASIKQALDLDSHHPLIQWVLIKDYHALAMLNHAEKKLENLENNDLLSSLKIENHLLKKYTNNFSLNWEIDNKINQQIVQRTAETQLLESPSQLWFSALLALSNKEKNLSKSLFSRLSEIDSKYTLSAKVFYILIDNKESENIKIYEKLKEDESIKENEIDFMLGALALNRLEYQLAHKYWEKALKNGFYMTFMFDLSLLNERIKMDNIHFKEIEKTMLKSKKIKLKRTPPS